MRRYIIESDTERDFCSGARLYWNNRRGWTARTDATRFTAKERAEREMPIGGARWVDIFPEVGQPMRCPRCSGTGYKGHNRATANGSAYRVGTCPRCGGTGEVLCTRPRRFRLYKVERGGGLSYWRNSPRSMIGWTRDAWHATRFDSADVAALESLGVPVGGAWQEAPSR